MKNLPILFLVFSLVSCASVPRTKATDPVLRILLDPDSIAEIHHVRIQQALVASGKWNVVDRSAAYRAVKKEQERQHRTESDRFNDREKWGRWSQLLGVGGIVVANVQCAELQTWFVGSKFNRCLQYLSIVNASTGEVIAAVESYADGESGQQKIAPSWEEAVAKLNLAYPTHYKVVDDHRVLTEYKDQAEKEAIAQKELVKKSRAPAAEDEAFEVEDGK